jgi:16S rRNA (guanine966-N2)-methyltransferase
MRAGPIKLRITAGSLKRRIIHINAASSKFRPTLERVRQAVMESLKGDIPDAAVADLCAGSGAFGFESLSRGAGRVDFIDCDAKRADGISSHCERFGVGDRCRVFKSDIAAFLSRGATDYHIIFYDPPYDDPMLAGLVDRILPHIGNNGILVYQRDVHLKADAHADRKNTDNEEEPLFDGFERRVRKYGRTIIEYYRRIAERE